MDDSKNIKEELKEFAPDLLKINKKEGFEVPPRYFEKLTDEVMYQIKKEKEVIQMEQTSWITNLVNHIQNLMQPRLAIGLVTAVLLLISIQFFNSDTEIEGTMAASSLDIQSISDEEFDSYLADNILDFEEELLDELVTEMSYIPESIEDEELNGFFNGEDLKSLEEELL